MIKLETFMSHKIRNACIRNLHHRTHPGPTSRVILHEITVQLFPSTLIVGRIVLVVAAFSIVLSSCVTYCIIYG